MKEICNTCRSRKETNPEIDKHVLVKSFPYKCIKNNFMIHIGYLENYKCDSYKQSKKHQPGLFD